MATTAMTKSQWIELFRELGLDDANMLQWHRLFEQRYPAQHQAFLQWLQIPTEEIEQIRQHSR